MTEPRTSAGTGAAVRPDLLALTPDTLAALANRGLVKRATKELDAGTVPVLTTDPDTTVRARFDDGTTSALPPGTGLDEGDCSCAAPGVCRHLIALVLAHQRSAASDPDGDPAAFTDWSPGSTDDDALTDAVGARPVASARRTLDRGYAALVHRPSPDHPEPRVELPTCTVRFPVPGEIAHALTDAAASLRGEVVALAVWAFRAADATDTDERSVPVQVGGRAAAPPTALPVLDAALGLVGELLAEGVAHVGPVHGGALARAGAALTARSMHWPAGAIAELADQLTAYADRTAQYRPESVAALLTEVHARRRAAGHPGVLGTREAGDTPLRRVRLVSLGCRVHGTGQSLTSEVYFAHPGAGTVLVLRKAWTAAEGKELSAHRLATRRVLGTTLASLAAWKSGQRERPAHPEPCADGGPGQARHDDDHPGRRGLDRTARTLAGTGSDRTGRRLGQQAAAADPAPGRGGGGPCRRTVRGGERRLRPRRAAPGSRGAGCGGGPGAGGVGVPAGVPRCAGRPGRCPGGRRHAHQRFAAPVRRRGADRSARGTHPGGDGRAGSRRR